MGACAIRIARLDFIDLALTATNIASPDGLMMASIAAEVLRTAEVEVNCIIYVRASTAEGIVKNIGVFGIKNAPRAFITQVVASALQIFPTALPRATAHYGPSYHPAAFTFTLEIPLR